MKYSKNAHAREIADLKRQHGDSLRFLKVQVKELEGEGETRTAKLVQLTADIAEMDKNNAAKVADLQRMNDTQRERIETMLKEAAEREQQLDTANRAVANDHAAQTEIAQAKRITWLQDELERATTAIARTGELALEIADENGYCTEYDDMVEAVNDGLRRSNVKECFYLPTREKEYRIEVRFNYSVKARDEEDAEEKAEEYYEENMCWSDGYTDIEEED